MGGGPVRTMNLLAWGVDLVEEQLLASAGALGSRCGPAVGVLWSCCGCCCRRQSSFIAAVHARPAPCSPLPPPLPKPTRAAGIPSRPNVAARPLRNIAEYSVNALKTGTLKDLDILDK